VENLLQLLARNAVDYTIFWRRLSHAVANGQYEPVRDLFADRPSVGCLVAILFRAASA